jgi:cytosine/adenosine deaminase-related metal-dependent hydrolase
VWLSERDAGTLAERGVSVAHNLGSNLRTGSGILPAPELLRLGVNVSVGMDGLTVGDDDDMMSELRLIHTLHRMPRSDGPGLGVSAAEAVRMGTTRGASALGLDGVVGRLAPGLKADVITIDLPGLVSPYVAPTVPLVDTIVQRGRSEHVDDVVVDGRVLLRAGSFVHVDEARVQTALVAVAEEPPSAASREWAELLKAVRPHVEDYYLNQPPTRACTCNGFAAHVKP